MKDRPEAHGVIGPGRDGRLARLVVDHLKRRRQLVQILLIVHAHFAMELDSTRSATRPMEIIRERLAGMNDVGAKDQDFAVAVNEHLYKRRNTIQQR